MQRLLARLRNLGFSHKISLAFILLNVLLIAMVVFAAQIVCRRIIYNQVEERSQYENRLQIQQFEALMSNINGYVNNLVITLNTGHGHQFESSGFPDSENLRLNQDIFFILDRLTLLFQECRRISIVFDNDVVYTVHYLDMNKDITITKGVYATMSELGIGTEGAWCVGNPGVPAQLGGDLSYVKSLRNINTNHTIGYIVMTVDEEQIYQLYGSGEEDQYTQIFFCDETGQILSSSNRDQISTMAADNPLLLQALSQENSFANGSILRYGKNRYYCDVSRVNNGKWRFVTLVDTDFASHQINLMTAVIVAISAVLIFIFAFLIVIISRQISNPIRRLAGHMIESQNAIPKEIPLEKAYGELEVLTANFNTMIRTNNALFDSLKEDQIKRRHLELALLQAQIKPHFLYNTLETAYCLVDMDNKIKAKKILKLLGDHYRYVLNKGSEWILLRNEIEALEKYLQIQKLRYNNLFRYEIDIPEELLLMRIPKMTLQPLVENAIYHGIKPLYAQGMVRISSEMEVNRIIIRIEDNGVGMTRETFEKVMHNEKQEKNNFGLKNVADRIRLFYGENSYVYMETIPVGTAIAISIDLKTAGGADV